MTTEPDRYTYSVRWDGERRRYTARVDEFPEVYVEDHRTPEDALVGVRHVVAAIVAGLVEAGGAPPKPGAADRIPPRALAVYSRMLYAVAIETRVMAWQRRPHEMIARALDTIHNLPTFFERWSEWDEARFIRDLGACDGQYGTSLAKRFERCVDEVRRLWGEDE